MGTIVGKDGSGSIAETGNAICSPTIMLGCVVLPIDDTHQAKQGSKKGNTQREKKTKAAAKKIIGTEPPHRCNT